MTTAEVDRRVEAIDGVNNEQGGIQRVSDLRSLPFVVLLGEPGSGKSTVLACEAAQEGAPVLKVRELMTGSHARPDATLFLDALDEYRTDGQQADKVHSLALSMNAVGASRWRLSCRSEDWRKGADMEPIRKTARGAPIVVVQLLPLEHDDAAAILSVLGEPDPEAFLAKAQSLGATGFTESPLILKLLRKAVADGGTWPSTRFDLFASAIRRLSFEFNDEHKTRTRRFSNDILTAAGEACLLALTSGARAIWRSNGEPPDDGDARAYVTAQDLQLDRDLLEDMLDTAMFRGEGEVFEPTHRTIAEFLAGEVLAKAVIGGGARAALPLSRAVALITDTDGLPPTELRGLYAWLAAHLAKLGSGVNVAQLIEADAVTVLAYGDAGVFDTPERRALLNNLDRNDPYFRASEVGITAVGGLAGEDLADDFTRVLTGPPDGTHRFYTVLDALTYGTPVKSLSPALLAVVLDATRPEWQRRRAVEAYLNGVDDRVGAIRELFDILAGEVVSTAREALRAHLTAEMPTGVLKALDVRSVLADYRRAPDDNMMGRLSSLQRRLEKEPVAELFDEPTTSWLPKIADRRHMIEVENVLDYALASAVRGTPNLSATRLWRWTVNVHDYNTSSLKDQSRRALAVWLDEGEGRETEFFDAILLDDNETNGPWMVTHSYITATRRFPSVMIIRHLLAKAESSSTTAIARRLLAIAVDITYRPEANIEAYWETYDRVAQEPGCAYLLKRLTVATIEDWRIEDQKRAIDERQQEANQKAANIQAMAPWLGSMRAGGRVGYLAWAARLYFSGTKSDTLLKDSFHPVTDVTNERTTEAIVAGWKFLSIVGLDNIDAGKLGKAEALNQQYDVEAAVLAGVNCLTDDNTLSWFASIPVEVAVAILKSSFIVSDTERRNRLEKWALDRLNLVPTTGSAQLIGYWSAVLDAGATQLSGIWRLTEADAHGGAVEQALASLLGMRRTMPSKALQSVLQVAARNLDHAHLLALSEQALADPIVTGEQRMIWSLTALRLDPITHADRFYAEHQGGDAGVLFDGDLIRGLGEAFGSIVDVARLHYDAMVCGLWDVRRLQRATNHATWSTRPSTHWPAIRTLGLERRCRFWWMIRRWRRGGLSSVTRKRNSHAYAEIKALITQLQLRCGLPYPADLRLMPATYEPSSWRNCDGCKLSFTRPITLPGNAIGMSTRKERLPTL